MSTVDLTAGRWSLLTARPCDAWQAAAGMTGIEVTCYQVPGQNFPAAVGIGPDGALLVRPDGFVAWRSPDGAGSGELPAVLAGLLGRE